MLCEDCANKLYDSYTFLCKVRSSEDSSGEKADNELIEILSTESDVESVKNEEDNIELIQFVEEINELYEVQALEAPIKRQKFNASDQRIPETIVTPHFYFKKWRNADGRLVKEINVTAKKRVLDENGLFNFQQDFCKEEEENVIIKCKYCEKAFTIEQHALVHLRKSHLCSVCLATFHKSCDVNAHIKTHKYFTCMYCQNGKKTFTSNALYKVHLKKSHGIQLPPHLNIISIDCRETLQEK